MWATFNQQANYFLSLAYIVECDSRNSNLLTIILWVRDKGMSVYDTPWIASLERRGLGLRGDVLRGIANQPDLETIYQLLGDAKKVSETGFRFLGSVSWVCQTWDRAWRVLSSGGASIFPYILPCCYQTLHDIQVLVHPVSLCATKQLWAIMVSASTYTWRRWLVYNTNNDLFPCETNCHEDL